MPSINTTNVTIIDDVQVTVPASPQFMTTYILQEQHDWFEDEIKFIRRFIKPGMNAIDIGANYGLYTLTIANILAGSGKIWSFEPTETTSACLKKSIACNKFDNIKLIRSGLSDRLGEAKLFTSPNSELNSLSKASLPGNQYEIISLLTLDHCKHKYGWEYIDFIKLDAEGEESNILKKGKKTLSSLSPLIMFELMHGENINLPLVTRFKNMGYDSYRLIPGLNTLVPFDHTKPFDGYLLNLFCCKEGKAVQLEGEGTMVRNRESKNATDPALSTSYIKKLSYASLWSETTNTRKHSGSADYLSILNSYIMSLSDTENNASKVGHLMSSLTGLQRMIDEGEQRVDRLVTFSRIAFDAGERELGVNILSDLIKRHDSNINYELSEPFLPASQRYDSIVPGNDANAWLFSSILERYIEKHAHSSYFSGHATLPILEQLGTLGYMDDNMRRRYKLLKSCLT